MICPCCKKEREEKDFALNGRLYKNCAHCRVPRAKPRKFISFFSDRKTLFDPQRCLICQKIFEGKNALKDHLKNVHSEKEKKIIRAEISSITSADRMVSRRDNFGRSKTYFPYRSKWEYLFSLWLTDKGAEWSYESEAISLIRDDGAHVHYIPDFILENPRRYVAIAGAYTRNDNMKILLFKEQYPEEKIEVWSPKTFEEYGLLDRFAKELQEKEALKTAKDRRWGRGPNQKG